jgi:rubrerythrin
VPNKLWATLRKDLAGEKKAVVDYGKRLKQVNGTKLAPIITEIQSDEQDHERLLKQSLRGLKASKPAKSK